MTTLLSTVPLAGFHLTGIEHCLDDEDSLQEVFMGSSLPPQQHTPAGEAATAEHAVDLARIEVDQCATDGLAEVLMATQ